MAGRPDEGGAAALGGSTTEPPTSPPAAVVVFSLPAEAPTVTTPFMPRLTWTWQKNGKVPALVNFTWQESPTLDICASPHLESSKRSSPSGLEPSPDTTGWGGPPAILKVTVPPGRTATSAGSHLLAAVPSTSALAWAAWAPAGPAKARASRRRRGRRRAAAWGIGC